jgi:hypothetical protein
MASTISDKLQHAWNAFRSEEETPTANWGSLGMSNSVRSDRVRMRVTNERSIIASIYTRIGIDVASVSMYHVRQDENEKYVETIKSYLNNCLTVEANLDQAASMFRQDIAMTMCDKGILAVVPVDTSLNPNVTGGYDILTMRVGIITKFYPKKVQVNLYDESDGKFKSVLVDKAFTAIIENPLYSVMNEPNGTLQRLITKLNMLDAVDEQLSSGKLDLIIQLPYVIRSEVRRTQANERRKALEDQLKDSKYGIGYADGTEKITQLNRPVENNLLKQVESLTEMLYGQLGITKQVLDGTADEATMLNYYGRTIEPILRAITEEMKRKFLTKTARTQGQSIMFFRDPFKLLSVSALAESVDSLSRNEITAPDEIRPYLGLKPLNTATSGVPGNRNMGTGDPNSPSTVAPSASAPATDTSTETPAAGDSAGFSDEDALMDSVFAELNADIDKLLGGGSDGTG